MASANITIGAVRSLQPGETIWDAGHREAVRGFGVRRQRGDPVYVIKYRAAGRQRFVTIGTHGKYTPVTARQKAKQLLGLVADGKDPADEKVQAALQAADTLGKIADQYLRHANQKLRLKQMRPRTYTEIDRYLVKCWKPLHSISVFKITRRHVSARIAEIAADQGAVTAARARSALSAMFNWAIREGWELPANPVLGTNRPVQPRSRERVLTDPELRAIWQACGDDDYGRIVRLLILTGQRRNEVGGMRWSEIAGDSWTIPGARTKNHREHSLPLTPAALAIIQAQPRRNDRDFIFGEGQRGFQGWSKCKARLDARIAAEGEPLPHWTVHDLRRTAATMIADRLGVLPHIVEAILNHVSGHKSGPAGIYNRARYSEEMRDALQRWADYVDDLTTPARPKALYLVRVGAE
jgi:integrase